MKIMTKEWVKDVEYHDLIVALKPNSKTKIPFVFTNGGTDIVAKEDLYTVKTDFNVTEKENEVNFVLLPETINLEMNNTGNDKKCKDEFLSQYLNRLRVISYLPDEILKKVKDKRLLALGYAEEKVKMEILKYIKSKYSTAIDLFEKCGEASVEAEKGLTVHKQFEKLPYFESVPFLFDGVRVTKVKTFKDEIYLTLDNRATVVFSGAEVIEEETEIANSFVNNIELYKNGNRYELHLLIRKEDANFIAHYYYVTYAFKDLKLEN